MHRTNIAELCVVECKRKEFYIGYDARRYANSSLQSRFASAPPCTVIVSADCVFVLCTVFIGISE